MCVEDAVTRFYEDDLLILTISLLRTHTKYFLEHLLEALLKRKRSCCYL